MSTGNAADVCGTESDGAAPASVGRAVGGITGLGCGTGVLRGAGFGEAAGDESFVGCGFGRAWKKFSDVTNRCELGAAGGLAAGAGLLVTVAAGVVAGCCCGAGGRTCDVWAMARADTAATRIKFAALPKFDITDHPCDFRRLQHSPRDSRTGYIPHTAIAAMALFFKLTYFQIKPGASILKIH